MTLHPCPECRGTGDVGGVEWDGTPVVLPCRLCAGRREITGVELADYREWGPA